MTKTDNMNTRNRRDFFRQLALGSAAFMILPPHLVSCSTENGSGNPNSIDLDGILPVALISDCADLIMQNSALSETTRKALTADINLNIPGNMSRIAGIIQFPDETVLELLNQVKENWNESEPDTVSEQRYSLFLGWMIYSGFRENTGRLYHNLIDNGSHYDDIRICHDTYILNQICCYPQTEPELSAEEYAELYNILLPRMITRLHTFKPDSEDGKKWINDMTNWRISNKELMQKYSEALLHPNEEHINEFVIKPGFYNSGDDIIQLVRKVQNGVTVTWDDVSSTMKSDSGNSLYAKGMVQGIKRAELTDKYSSGDLTFGEFSQGITSI